MQEGAGCPTLLVNAPHPKAMRPCERVRQSKQKPAHVLTDRQGARRAAWQRVDQGAFKACPDSARARDFRLAASSRTK